MATTILKGFFERLESFNYFPLPAIMWPGLNQAPPTSGLWIEPGYFPNEHQDDVWDDDTCVLFRGFAQALIGFRPNDGLVAPYELADALIAWFPKGQAIGPVRVRKRPWASPHFVGDGDKLFIPVTIRLTGFVE